MHSPMPFEKNQIPGAVYAVDSVLVNAGMFRNSVTVTGPSVTEGAAAGESMELEEDVVVAEAAAVAVAVGEMEGEDVEDFAMIRRDGGLANFRKNL